MDGKILSGIFVAGFIVLLLGVGPAQAADAQKCQLSKIASFDVSPQKGAVIIPVKIGDREAHMVIDTGSPVSMIAPELVSELKLKTTPFPGGRLMDFAGRSITQIAKVPKLQLDQMHADNVSFFVQLSPMGPGIDGLIGMNFLQQFDIEFDLAHGKFNLFSQDHCPGRVVYWSEDFDSIPFKLDASRHLDLSVTLDGKDLKAGLDTGMTYTTLFDKPARKWFGIDPKGEGATPAGTLAGIPFYTHRFQKLEVGGVAFQNTELRIILDKNEQIYAQTKEKMSSHNIGLDTNTQTDIILGLRHLAKVRLYIAFGESKIYVSAANAQ